MRGNDEGIFENVQPDFVSNCNGFFINSLNNKTFLAIHRLKEEVHPPCLLSYTRLAEKRTGVRMDKKKLTREAVRGAYAQNPHQAEQSLFGRMPCSDRRGFLKRMGLASMTTMLGAAAMPFHRNWPVGLMPAAFAAEADGFFLEGKAGLTILNDRPINAETPAHLLDDNITPASHHFVRNNGIPPTNIDPDSWTLTIDGLVDKPLSLSIADLKSRFEVITQQLVLECAGNGRRFFEPGAKGNQWTHGAVGCAAWTGVRLSDVLQAAGVQQGAVYTAHFGADKHLSGKPDKRPISRGVPIEKALRGDCLLAFGMNGEDIHPLNGAPLRLVVPGWPASCSQKWLTRITLRDQVHDGAKMTGKSYRVPNRPVAPGEKVAKKDFEIIEQMPVKSLITYPQNGVALKGNKTPVRGHAWAGEKRVRQVQISTDFGATWQDAKLDAPVNPGAWQHFSLDVTLAQVGYYEIWAKATDEDGISQPFAIDWNPKGYLNNQYHRVAVRTG